MKRRNVSSTLVSVIIPTYNRAELLCTRSIPSVLAQTHRNLDLHVIGDGATPEVVDAMATITDPRFRFTQRPRPKYPPGELDAWHISGTYAANYGLDHVRGEYVCALADDDSYEPEYVEKLLNALVETDSHVAYCASRVHKPDGTVGYLGLWYPPMFARQSGGEFIWRKSPVRLDPECWRKGLPNDWDFHSRLMAGRKVTHVREPLYNYYPMRHVPPCSPTM